MRSKNNKKVKKNKITLLILIIIIVAICSIVFILKPKKETHKEVNSIIGKWAIEGNTNNEFYEFYEDGKGNLQLPNSNYAFSYIIEGDKLHIDFEYEKAEDPNYKIIYENDKIIIEGINPTTGKFTFIKSN